ncbi:UNVERIFIED_CONTAM: hypothetical protein GTU68_038838 [Idotea baltica]|nr:hypothetical protein [Idotea baltica]MCL4126139.1 hypothetical protein [Idotea baltica]MCL4126140.1 hypothetical protein [Idotea baltica]MCL4126141.1 hypothetical protein [Idotea baltica]
MVGPTETWVSQLGDMFNVEDYPIEGYSLPDVITELNFNFEYCAIDYRPLHLPLKCYMTIDSLAISSNVTVKGNSSVLLFFIEDAGLFLSQNLACKNVNLKDNYVCVADLGVFELCIKLDESSDIPVRELLFSNNIIHLRTCSDSFKALMEMIIYLANEGDLIQEPDHHKIKEKTLVLEPSHVEETSHSPLEENATICHKFMENLMQEAMVESRLPDKMSSVKIQEDSEEDTFFFPDENTKGRKVSHGSTNKFHELDTEMALREAQEELSSEILDDNKPGTDDEFCFLDEVPGTGIQSPTGKPKVKYLRPEIIVIKDDHFNPSNNYSLNTPKHFPKPHTQYNLQELSIVWHMYGGKDFEEEKDLRNDRNGNHKVQLNTNTSPFNSPPPSVKFKEVQCVSFVNDASIASERSASVSFSKPPASKLSKPNANVKWFTIGGPNRCHDTLMEIQLNKIRLKYDLYPEKCSLVSRHVLAVNDIEIRDRLASSKINKFLYQYSSENCPKQASSNMIQVKAITKRSDPSVSSSETSLNISVRPIRLNIDQDALIFLSSFFENVAISEKEVEFGEEERPSNSFSHAPVLTLNHNYDRFKEERIDELLVHEERVDVVDKDSPVYFRNVVFSPDVPIKIDYHGKHVDINSQYGALAGLIIGLGQLDHSEITLKRVEFKSGVLGVGKLANSLTNEWIYDIRKNQLPSILGGVGPMHSFVKLFSGFKDLFWLPVEQYNKDGRVLRGLQKGTSAFTSSSAYAVLDLTGRFVGCIQATAETMYDMVSSGPSVRNKSYKKRKGQPKDIREGVTAAFGLVRNGLGDTANTLMKVASDEHSHKGVSGAVGGVLRQIPPSVVQPIIIASEATCTFIGGMTNQLVPDARREAAEKWKA